MTVSHVEVERGDIPPSLSFALEDRLAWTTNALSDCELDGDAGSVVLWMTDLWRKSHESALIPLWVKFETKAWANPSLR